MSAGAAEGGMGGVVNQRAVLELCKDIGTAATRDFIYGYLAMLSGRVSRLRDAVAADDLEGARVAAMSLHSSSVMVGADPLADVAKALMEPLARGDLETACDLTVELFVLSAATRVALRDMVTAKA